MNTSNITREQFDGMFSDPYIEEYIEQRFIELRPRNGTMIFLGWNEVKQLHDFVDYHGCSRNCSKDFLLGYIEGITMIASNV